jgi:uncharacterized protein (DUF924 family)
LLARLSFFTGEGYLRDTKQEVLKFWFEETQPQQWFQKDESFDREITERFSVTYDMAKKDLCADWTKDADGSLALCLVLDQFPRNMFRDSPKAFETDKKALLISKEALHRGYDMLLPTVKRKFLYMPFMHSENIDEQNRCVSLFGQMQEEEPLSYDYAMRHKEVIEEYGRFPHRNVIIGRESTKEEIEYLKSPGAGF